LSTGLLRFERNNITLADEVPIEEREIVVQTPRLRLDFDRSETAANNKILTGIDEDSNFLEIYTELEGNDEFN
jgi:hypothetical protein